MTREWLDMQGKKRPFNPLINYNVMYQQTDGRTIQRTDGLTDPKRGDLQLKTIVRSVVDAKQQKLPHH